MTFKDIMYGLLALVGVIALGWILNLNGLASYRYFAPKVEQVRHDTFKQSQAYMDGMSQDILGMKLDYAKADEAGKKTIADVVYHRAATIDLNDYSADVRSFVEEMRRVRTGG